MPNVSEPIRTCLGCGKTEEQRKLVRIVLDATGRVKVDRNRSMAGRGGWLHELRACVEKTTQNNGLPRAFKRRTQPLDASVLWGQLQATTGVR